MKSMIKIVFSLILLMVSQLGVAKGIAVDDPYARAIPPGQKISAAFMTLINETDKSVDLIKASSDSAKNVELHEHIHEDGMMKMRQVPKISIPANGKTTLKPGGYHIMLIGLVKQIKPNDIVTINLEFSDGSKQSVKADVRKIMMGMMKKKMKKKMSMINFKQHANPMPNLLSIYKKMGDKLNLSDEQKSKLNAGIKTRSPKIKALYAEVKSLEKALQQAALADKTLGKIDIIADQLMQARLAIIKGKAGCRESIKKVLSEKQLAILVKLYREKMMPKGYKTKIARMKHVSPMPDFMSVITKQGDKLKLSEKQAADLKKWRDERGPITEKVAQTIVKMEMELLEAALNNAPLSKINEIADAIMQNRVRLIRTKAMSRDNIKRILDNQQYATVLGSVDS